MFFLGISAHLFIYLLVPAFLIVCFYFRGIAGNPEVNPILPEAIVYEYSYSSFSEETFIYQIEKKEKPSFSLCDINFEYRVEVILPAYQSGFYLSPVLSGKPLRAPPFFI